MIQVPLCHLLQEPCRGVLALLGVGGKTRVTLQTPAREGEAAPGIVIGDPQSWFSESLGAPPSPHILHPNGS